MILRRTILSLAPALVSLPTAAAAATRTVSAISRYEAETGGRIGVYARNLVTGRSLAWRENERFIMCSTFKASLAALVLHRVDQGLERLDAPVPYRQADIGALHAPVARAGLAAGALSVQALCQGAVEQSDNVCANLLLDRVGGPLGLTRFWRSLGDRSTRLDDREPALNQTPEGDVRNTTTPRAMAEIFEHLLFAGLLSESSRALLVDWLKNCRTGASRLRAGLPADWSVGDKTGNNGRDAAGDLAIAWPVPDKPLILCVYTQGGHPVEAQLHAAFAGIGRMVAQALLAE